MKFDIVTLFPKMFEGVFGESIIKRAVDKKLVEIKTHDMRQWAWNNYGAVDDKPYGGDIGMLIRVDVIGKALNDLGIKKGVRDSKIIMLSARGKKYNQQKAEELANLKNITLLCGRYEGFDQRISDLLIDEEISIGDYVLTGGEIGAMVVIDSVARLLPGVLGKDKSSKTESFSEIEIGGKKIRPVEYPQYTRPQTYEGLEVPDILISGDLKKIEEWKKAQIKKSL